MGETAARYAVRAARRGDIDEIVALCREHAAFEGADYAAEGKAARLASALFGDHPRLWCRVAADEDGEGVIGDRRSDAIHIAFFTSASRGGPRPSGMKRRQALW